MESLLLLAVKALKYVIFADVILSWIMPNPAQFPRSLTTQITTPLYAPIHKVLNPQSTGGIDLSPIVLIVLLHIMESKLLSVM